MTRAPLLLVALLGCAELPQDQATDRSLDEELAVAPAVFLPDFMASQTATIELVGAAPGENVGLITSLGGVGPGPCPPSLGGLCFDVLPPLRTRLAIADGAGVATFNLMVPDRAGDALCVQGAIRRGAGGIDSVSTSVQCVTIAPETRWYDTCGDPVCGGYAGPFPGIPVCTSQTEPDICLPEGDACDLVNGCNQLMLCAQADPAAGPCPVSRRRHKRDVSYLSDAEVDRAAAEALSMRLATWRYNWDDPAHPEHLGFLIDDVEQSPAVAADGEHVDLYGYTSLTLAALQSQARQIERLEAKVAALEGAR